MKVLLFVTGIGLGDATREHSNIKEFLKEDKNTEFLIVGYNNSYKYFKDKYNTIEVYGYNLPGFNLKFQTFSFLFTNFFLPLLWIYYSITLNKQFKKFNPDIIITDFEPLGILCARKLKKPCFTIFGYDPEHLEKKTISFIQNLQKWYIKQLYNLSSYIIIPSLLKKKENFKNFYFVDSTVRTLPSELKTEKELMEKLRLKKKPILVSIGGSGFGTNLSNQVFKTIENINENFIVFGYPASFSRENIQVFEFKENFLEYLKVAKGIITLAGRETLSESLTFKKPMLIFPIENHIEQLANAEELKDVAVIGDKEDIPASIKKFIKSIPSQEEKLKDLKVNPKGSSEIVQTILKIIKDKSK